MREIMIYFLLLSLPVSSFCQKSNDSVPVIKTDYLAKSKSQKTAAFILLGIGVTTLTIAAVGDLDFDALGAVVVVGGVATVASIPLFIASGKNKRKAMKASAFIKLETIPLLQKQSFESKPFPAFSVNFSL
ncbi:MAG TPA: hypothetical protein VFZ33_05195 [Chitinophagaceae bacterium]